MSRSRRPGNDGHQGEDRADGDERQRDAADRDEKGRQKRADRERGHQEPLEKSENARQQVRPSHALEQRAARDVECRPCTSGNRDQDEGAERAGKRRETHESSAPDTDREHERQSQPRQPDETSSDHDRHDAPRAESRAEITRPIPAAAEHALRELDVEHVESAERDALRCE